MNGADRPSPPSVAQLPIRNCRGQFHRAHTARLGQERAAHTAHTLSRTIYAILRDDHPNGTRMSTIASC